VTTACDELLRAYGYNATSSHLGRSAFRVWHDEVRGAAIAYVDTGSAWVASGAPVAPLVGLAAAVEGFTAAARAHRRRVVLFGVEHRLLAVCPSLASLLVGEQPVWDPQAWEETRRKSSSLRHQLGRAARKGVSTRWLEGDAITRALPALHALVAQWSARHVLPPMGFQVRVDLEDGIEHRRFLVAERDDRIVGALVVARVYQRGGHFLEHALREADAPNGVIELLFDRCLTDAAADGSPYATLGLAPLRGDVAPLLRWSRELGEPLYRFSGLAAFKERLRPHRWDAIYMAYPADDSPTGALIEVLRAFAGGSFLTFGRRLGARLVPSARRGSVVVSPDL
jgi:phosphatidylglycerol lysyltransferase